MSTKKFFSSVYFPYAYAPFMGVLQETCARATACRCGTAFRSITYLLRCRNDQSSNLLTNQYMDLKYSWSVICLTILIISSLNNLINAPFTSDLPVSDNALGDTLPCPGIKKRYATLLSYQIQRCKFYPRIFISFISD